LLVCAIGCSPLKNLESVEKTVYETRSFGYGITVDGIDYSATGMARVDSDGKIFLSAIMVYPSFRLNGHIAISHIGGVEEILIHDGSGFVEFNDPGCFTVYFMENRRVVFSKTYAELGIDVDKPFPGEFVTEKIHPILEKLIRENVQPQEPEREELL